MKTVSIILTHKPLRIIYVLTFCLITTVPMCDAIEGDHVMMIGEIDGKVSAGGLAGVRCEPGLWTQIF